MAETKRMPVTDPKTGKAMVVDQPGYYPGFSTLDQQGYWDDATRQVVLTRMTSVKPLRFFTAEEAATMAAVMDRVLPQEDRAPGRRIPLLPALDDRLFHNRIDGYRYEDMPSDQETYRIAAKAIAAMAHTAHGMRFEQMGTTEQERLLQSLHAGKPASAEAMWEQMNLTRFWALLVSDCCAGYYSHPWSWDEVGFGGPAYPRGYMRLEEGEAEPWEVDEVRYAWAAPADTITDTAESEETGGSEQSRPGQGGTH